MWAHVEERSGAEIARFVRRYVKEPILEIAGHEERLLDLGLQYVPGAMSDSVQVSEGR